MSGPGVPACRRMSLLPLHIPEDVLVPECEWLGARLKHVLDGGDEWNLLSSLGVSSARNGERESLLCMECCGGRVGGERNK